ncbi:hypothetical protein [Curtobacterium sp. MCBA15_001]|uniref:hypothetical protein n=1 Tax=Curtobacterium sp. MCBA15_001 TaxID=1898731 RepID=UPI0008DD2194|nr:hypothetical protein [Curtobacterium sp. MCBA15_001]OIH96516.1 hypothetical protein BIU90_16870 [Curtobacterium sp. MCBA15_001]
MSTSPPDTAPSGVLATEDGPAPRPLRPLIAVAGRDTDDAIRSLAGMYAGNAWYSRAIDDRYWSATSESGTTS